MSLLELVFFVCLFGAAYPYGIYPVLVRIWSVVGKHQWRRGDSKPSVSLIISVYNEEDVIREKIENALSLEYPPEKLEILVVSDGSTDDTHAIVSSFTDERVKLKAYDRAGKTACLNRVVAEADGEVLVFTDANSIFPPHTLAKIVRNYSDDDIGLVTGWTKYRRSASDIEGTTGLYGRLEMATKVGESLVSSCVGADGAVFAIRKYLYRQLEDYDINDFVIPLNVLDQAKRVVLDRDVFCIEEPSEGFRKEFKRQARITNRTLGAIKRNAKFLNPVRFGTFAFFLLSHKLLRFMVPFFAGGTLFASSLLMSSSPVYLAAFGALLVFLLVGGVGLLGIASSRVVDVCATFLLTNAAQVVGWARFVTGRADVIWTPQR